MSTGIPIDFKETVRAQTDIVSLVSEYVALTPERGGRVHKGLCPFHDDHNPSMNVSPERQSYKCWSCGEGGDCFSFLMKIESIEFREALERLATRANLEIPKAFSRPSGANKDKKNELYEIVSWAERVFHHELLEGPQSEPARRYLEEDRGFNDETIKRFRIGCHPGGWQWLIDKARGKYTEQQLFAARLVREKDRGGYYDDFRQRVLFPIRNSQGQPVAFGGRIIPGLGNSDAPKYLNSPESEIFLKSKILYGFDTAKDSIRKSEVAVVVEGYTDCITLQQFGLNNVVGTLGVALSEEHVSLLKRFARQKMVLLYDGDEAGQRATERSLSRFLSQDVDLRILILPSGMDPAEYVEQMGPESLQTALDSAPEALEFKYKVSRERHGDSVQGRQRILEEMLDLVLLAPNLRGTIKEDLILNRLSQRLSVDEHSLRQMVVERRESNRREQRRKTKRQFERQPEQKAQPTQSELSSLTRYFEVSKEKLVRDSECDLLQIIFIAPETIYWVSQQVSADDFENPTLAHLFQFCCDIYEQGEQPSGRVVMAALEDLEYKKLVGMIDELSFELDIKSKFEEEQVVIDDEPVSRYLFQAVDRLIRRRQEREAQTHIRQLVADSVDHQTESGLNDKAIAALQKATQLHQQRATTKEISNES